MHGRQGVVFCAILAAIAVVNVTCLTNQELYDVLTRVSTDIPDDDSGDTDVIVVPGKGDDVIDLEFLLKALGFKPGHAPELQNVGWWHNSKGVRELQNVGWWHDSKDSGKRHPVGWIHQSSTDDDRELQNAGWWHDSKDSGKRHPVGWIHQSSTDDVKTNPDQNLGPGYWWAPKLHYTHPTAPWCQCHKYGCSCCLMRRIEVKKQTFEFNPCVTVDYDHPSDRFFVAFVVNGYTMYSIISELKENIRECFVLPGTKSDELCVKIYDIDRKQMRMCAAIEGDVVTKGHEKSANLRLGCFKIKKPKGKLDAMESNPNVDTDDTYSDERQDIGARADLAEVFRELQEQQGDRSEADNDISDTDETLRYD